MDYSKLTLGELLSSGNETIKRNAVSILKQLQNKFICFHPQPCLNCKKDKRCWAQIGDNEWCKNQATHGDYCKKHADMFPL